MRTDDGLSEYEMQRRRTIERNHRKLQELGLVGRAEVAASSKTSKQGQTSRTATPTSVPGAAVRRSQRAKGKTAPVYTNNAVGFDDEVGGGGGNGSRKRARNGAIAPRSREQQQESPAVPSGSRRSASKPSPPDSSRNLECDIPRLMEEHLGQRFPAFGKSPVMDTSTKSRPPKFSRMSGVTEWNNAVFLWVNVGEGGGYTNLFEGSMVAAARDNVPSPVPKRSTGQAMAGVWEDSKHAVQRDESAAAAPDCRRAPSRPSTQNFGSGQDGRVTDATVNGPASEEDGRSAELKMTWYAGGRMTAESALIRRLLQGSDSGSAVRVDGDAAKATVVQLSDEAGVSETNLVKEEREPTAAAVGIAKSAILTLPKLGRPGNGLDSRVKDHVMESNAVTAAAATAAADDGGCDPSASVAPTVEPSIGDGLCEDAVLLFCRLPKEPYVFCGRLRYAEHWPGERPVRFVWRLLDAGRLAGCPDFGAIVEAAGVEAAAREVEEGRRG